MTRFATQQILQPSILESFVVRPFLVALLLLGLIHQHFTCCCDTACACVCNDQQQVADSSTTLERCQHEHSHKHDHETCGHHEHEDTCPSPVQSGNDSHHDHHVCIGSHIFFVTSSAFSMDFAPVSCWILWLPEIQNLKVGLIALPSNFDAVDRWQHLSPQKLRAHLCVYCV